MIQFVHPYVAHFKQFSEQS